MFERVGPAMKEISEMVAGDGSKLSMPPAFVFVNPKQHRKYKKANQDKKIKIITRPALESLKEEYSLRQMSVHEALTIRMLHM